MDPLDRPLFVVGTGRCGSTVLHEMLAHHEQLSYLTHALDRGPHDPARNSRLMGLREHAMARAILRWRIEPSEAWHFWDHWIPGLSEPCRDLRADDAGPRVRQRVQRVLTGAARTGDRMLVKFTGWPRLGWILACAPGARVVHVVRDARAVTNSMMNVRWWQGWSGPHNWSFGPLDAREQEVWDSTGRDFAALGCLEWLRLLEAFVDARDRLDPTLRAQVLEVRYDELCDDRDATLRRILEFAELPWSERFARQVRRYALESRDDKWRRDLSAASQEAMEQVLEGANWRRFYPEMPRSAAPAEPEPASNSR